jgi:hypothetical protein
MSTPVTAEKHFPKSKFWDGYIRHDSLHFNRIIYDGYRVETDGRWKGMSTSAAFFPLYPYTVKFLAGLRAPGHRRIFASIWPPGLIFSNVSLLLALFYILRIARLSLDEDAAQRSLVYLLAFPYSFFFSCFYSEGPFLLMTAASFYHFLKKQHFRSGVWGMLAAMTRSPGVVLLPAFLLGHLWQDRGRLCRSDLSMLWLGLIPCGLVAVMGILYLQLGDPFAFSKAHSAWGRSYLPPYLTLWRALRSIVWRMPYGNFPNTVRAMETVSSLVFLALPFCLLRGFHKALPIYALLTILMPLSTGIVLSMLRCEAVAFPAFFALAKFGEDRRADRLIVYGFALFLAVFKLAFSNGYSVF